MLTLPIKKKWFDMILSGEKKEEYRDIKPYYDSRLMNLFGAIWVDGVLLQGEAVPEEVRRKSEQMIEFRNGYSNNSPSFVARCMLSTGQGNPDWGAEPNKRYYVLKILEMIK